MVDFGQSGAFGGFLAAQQLRNEELKTEIERGQLGVQLQSLTQQRQKMMLDVAQNIAASLNATVEKLEAQLYKEAPFDPTPDLAFTKMVHGIAARVTQANKLLGMDEALAAQAGREVEQRLFRAAAAPRQQTVSPGATIVSQTPGGVKEAYKAPDTPTSLMRDVQAAFPGDPAAQRNLMRQSLSRPTTNIQFNAENAAEQELGKSEGKQAATLIEGRAQANDVRNQLNSMRALAQAFKKAGGSFGAAAGLKITVGNIAEAAGINPKALGLPEDRGAGEAMQGMANDLVLGKLGGSLGAQVSDPDRKFLEITVPRIENSERGLLLKLDIAERIQERRQHLADRFDEARASGQSVVEANRAVMRWARENPLFTDAERRGINTVAPQPEQKKDFSKMDLRELLEIDPSTLNDADLAKYTAAMTEKTKARAR